MNSWYAGLYDEDIIKTLSFMNKASINEDYIVLRRHVRAAKISRQMAAIGSQHKLMAVIPKK